MNPHDYVFQLFENQRRLTEALGVNSQMEALTRSSELLRSHFSGLNATAEAMRASVESQVSGITAASEAMRAGIESRMSGITAASEAMRSQVESASRISEAFGASRMFRDLERMAEQQRALVDSVVTEPFRRLQELNRPLFEGFDSMRTAYDAISESILKVDMSVVSTAADCAVAFAHGEIEISVAEADDDDIEVHDDKGVLDPIVKDLKKSPAFVPLLMYACMIVTATTMSVVPNEKQQEAGRFLRLLFDGAGAFVMMEQLAKSWEKMSKKDDEV